MSVLWYPLYSDMTLQFWIFGLWCFEIKWWCHPQQSKHPKNSSWRWDYHIVTNHHHHQPLRCSSINNSSSSSWKSSLSFHRHFGHPGSCCQLGWYWKASSWRQFLFIPATCFLCCHKTSETKYPVTQCHIPEDWIPCPHLCRYLKTCMSVFLINCLSCCYIAVLFLKLNKYQSM